MKRRAYILLLVTLVVGLCGGLSMLVETCSERVREAEGFSTPQGEQARRDSIRARSRPPQGEPVPRRP